MPSARSSRNFYGWGATGGSSPPKSLWAFAFPRSPEEEGEGKPKLPTKGPLSWPPVSRNSYCKSRAPQSPTYNHLKLKTKLKYPKCFLKAKSTGGPKQLCKLEERGTFSLVLLQREVPLSAFRAGKEKNGLRKTEGERELPFAVAFAVAIHLPQLTATDRKGTEPSPYGALVLKRQPSPCKKWLWFSS